MYYNVYNSYDELYHHGVKGQKLGVIRNKIAKSYDKKLGKEDKKAYENNDYMTKRESRIYGISDKIWNRNQNKVLKQSKKGKKKIDNIISKSMKKIDKIKMTDLDQKRNYDKKLTARLSKFINKKATNAHDEARKRGYKNLEYHLFDVMEASYNALDSGG